ncbi:MAG: DUF5784 family protein [Halobacteria archaeon]|nr:DUF5784 family protein [Halobacteria archaeon]
MSESDGRNGNNGYWNTHRFENRVVAPLDSKFGVTVDEINSPDGNGNDYEARRLRIGDDSDELALFAWNGNRAYWLGNTETPEVLWRTDKVTFDEAPDEISEWAQRELYRILKQEEPELTEYTHLAWFFLPVLMSKDGRETAREFLLNGAGFPDTDSDEALAFYDGLIQSGVFDGYRYTMASKLGTRERHSELHMAAAMAEFNAAKILHDSGYDIVPEVSIDGGYSLDFAVEGEDRFVEVTRPERKSKPVKAVKEATKRKSNGQLNDTEALLFVDCSNFDRREWGRIASERPNAHHEPTVFYWMRPGNVEAFAVGKPELDLMVQWV